MVRPVKFCIVDGCYSYPDKGRGLCNRHYLQVRRGQLSLEGAETRQESMWKFIELCAQSNTDECLEPPRKCTKDNYPSVHFRGSRNYKIGWIVLEITGRNRPEQPADGKIVMRHFVCGNQWCCNPRHLCWGTERENAADRKVHGTEPDRSGRNNGNYRHGMYTGPVELKGPRLGEDHQNSKLTEAMVLEIRLRNEIGGPGNTNARIAEDFGIRQQTVSKICRRKLWRHI